MSVNYRAKLVWGTSLTPEEHTKILEDTNYELEDYFIIPDGYYGGEYILGVEVMRAEDGQAKKIEKLCPTGTLTEVARLYRKAGLSATHPIDLYLVHEVS